ncbi:MAG: hypothetical protein EXS16_07765 [Gemmataceae bacterium]|nr:hypothetical protein [Gemmataceae bacterium]
MDTPFLLLKIVAQKLGNAMGGGIAGDLAVEVIPSIAKDIWAWWKKEESPDKQQKELEKLAATQPEEIRRTIAAIVRAEVAEQSMRKGIEAFVNEIPAKLRREKAESNAKLTPPKDEDQLLDFMPGRQLDIIDAILGAYPNSDDEWLSANLQVELLWKAKNAKRSNGEPAFLAMAKWDGKERTVRLVKHTKEGKAVKKYRKQMFKRTLGVSPADIGVSQLVVDALVEHEVIPWYDINIK